MSEEGIRPGEIAVTLPDTFDAGVYFIGRIRTPWTRRERLPEERTRLGSPNAPIELDPRYAAALEGVAGCTHLVLLYFMHQARRDLVMQAPRTTSRARGTFSVRSPVRPNPIAMSVVRLVRVEGTTLTVVGLDCLDGTPLIDIKPYFASVDSGAGRDRGWSTAGLRLSDERRMTAVAAVSMKCNASRDGIRALRSRAPIAQVSPS